MNSWWLGQYKLCLCIIAFHASKIINNSMSNLLTFQIKTFIMIHLRIWKMAVWFLSHPFSLWISKSYYYGYFQVLLSTAFSFRNISGQSFHSSSRDLITINQLLLLFYSSIAFIYISNNTDSILHSVVPNGQMPREIVLGPWRWKFSLRCASNCFRKTKQRNIEKNESSRRQSHF